MEVLSPGSARVPEKCADVASDIELFERQLDSFVFARGEMILVDHARAGVPAQQGIVISGGTNRFRLFKPVHRFAEPLVSLMSATGSTARELRLGQALRQYPAVIRVFVLAPNSR